MAKKILKEDLIDSNAISGIINDLNEALKVVRQFKGELKKTLSEQPKLDTSIPRTTEEVKNLSSAYDKQRQLINALRNAEAKETEIQKQIRDGLVAEKYERARVSVETQKITQYLKEEARLRSESTSAYDKASINLNRLRKEYKDLAITNNGNTKEAKQLLVAIQQLDSELKAIDASVGQHQRSVGDYAIATNGLGSAIGAINNQLGGYIGQLTNFTSAITASAQGVSGLSGGLSKLKVALISTGIGALVVALGSIVAILSKVDNVVDSVESNFAGLGGVFNTVTQDVSRFGSVMGDVFKSLFSVEARENVKQFFKELVDNAGRAKELREELQNLEDIKGGVELFTQANEAEVERLRIMAKNRTLDLSVRKSYIEQAERLERENLETKKRLNNEFLTNELNTLSVKSKLSISELQQIAFANEKEANSLLDRRNLNKEDIDRLRGYYNEQIQIERDSNNIIEKLQNVKDTFYQKEAEIAEKRREEKLKRREEYLAKLKEAEDRRNKFEQEIRDARTSNIKEDEARAKETLLNQFDDNKKRIEAEYSGYVEEGKILELLNELRANYNKEYLEIEKEFSEKRQKELEDRKKRQDELIKSEYEARENVISNMKSLQELENAEIELRKLRNKEIEATEAEKIDLEIENSNKELEILKLRLTNAEDYGQDTVKVKTEIANKEIEIEKLKNSKLKQLTEDEIKLKKEQAKFIDTVTNESFKRANARIQDEGAKLDREINSSNKRLAELERRASEGNKYAEQSIAVEQKRIAELEAKKEKLEKKKQKSELAKQTLNTYSSKLQSGDKNALLSTTKDISLLMAFINGLPTFLKGTKDTGKGGNLDKDGGFLSILHEHERVFTKEENKALLGLESSQVIEIFNKGLKTTEPKSDSSEIIKAINEVPSKIPHTQTDWAGVGQGIIEVIKRDNKIERNLHKIGGIW